MSSLPILDLIAGLIFIYFLLTLVNNSCLELMAVFLQGKAVLLSRWGKKIFGPQGLDFIHATNGTGVPTDYIEPRDFARALAMHLFPRGSFSGASFSATDLHLEIEKATFPEALKKLLKNFADKSVMAAAATNSGFMANHFELQVEQWFHSHMAELTNRYKRVSQIFTFAFATGLTLFLNIDTLELASYLYSNRSVSQHLADRAYAALQNQAYDQYHRQSPRDSLDLTHQSLTFSASETEIQDTNDISLLNQLPLGWPDDSSAKPRTRNRVIKKTGGLFITIMAICLGAPFWFEVLGKVANLRGGLSNEKQNTK